MVWRKVYMHCFIRFMLVKVQETFFFLHKSWMLSTQRKNGYSLYILIIALISKGESLV